MRSQVQLMIDPDEGPLGYRRERPASAYPRRRTTMTVPVSWPHVAHIDLPEAMSEAEWSILMAFLELTRRASLALTALPDPEHRRSER